MKGGANTRLDQTGNNHFIFSQFWLARLVSHFVSIEKDIPMMKTLSIYVAAVICVLLYVTASATVGNDIDPAWLIVPGGKVGSISPDASESDLVKLYGKNNIKNEKIYLYNEGTETEIGTVIYPNDPQKKLKILWKDTEKKKFLKRVELFGNKSCWKIAEGISLGTSLKELERINGSKFILWGFGWDAGGFIKTWGNGKLANKYGDKVSIRLDTISRVKKPENSLVPENVTKDEFFSVNGAREFSSKHPIMQKINPTVMEIFVNFK